MMMLFVYFILAVVMIAFAVVLTRQSATGTQRRHAPEKKCGHALLDDASLNLAERIFDPGDYRWLHDEIGFPELSRELTRQRKAMALMWLRCLRTSFNELVRVPLSAGMPEDDNLHSTGWGMTFQTLRFQFLLSYAILVVSMFGPYTRMAPTFGWLRPLMGRAAHKERHGLRA